MKKERRRRKKKEGEEKRKEEKKNKREIEYERKNPLKIQWNPAFKGTPPIMHKILSRFSRHL